MKKKKIRNPKIPGTPTANDLKDMQKRHYIQNKKNPTAKSTLERDGGAANIYGASINNAFFNRAMGHDVDASEFEVSPTGLAVAGDISVAGDAGTNSDGASAGGESMGGDMGGGMGESLESSNGDITIKETDLIPELTDFCNKVERYKSETIKDYSYRLYKLLKDKYTGKLSDDILNQIAVVYANCNNLNNVTITSTEISEENDMSKKTLINNRYRMIEEEETIPETEAETEVQSIKDSAKIVLDAISKKNDKNLWTNTAKTVIDNVPNSALSVLWNEFKNQAGKVKMTAKGIDDINQTIDDIDDEELSSAAVNSPMNTVKEVLDLIESNNIVNKYPNTVKPILVVIASVIAVIEPTLLGEALVAAIIALPDNVVLNIVKALCALSPVKLLVSFVKGIVKLKENEELDESYHDDDDEIYFKAAITNLGKYNEGDLVFEWVEFPIDEDDFDKVLEKIGIGSVDEFGVPYEEWFVSDYDSNIDTDNLGEYESYETLQNIGEAIADVNDNGTAEIVQAALEVCDGTFEEIAEAVYNGDIIYLKDVTNNADLGYYYIDEIYGGDIPAELAERYLDVDALGRDLRIDYSPMGDEDDEDYYETAGEYYCGDENASDRDIGDAYIEMVGLDDTDLTNYFDYDAYGRDTAFDGYTFTRDGCVGDLR